MTYLKLLRKNLTRKKLRMFLTAISIFAAFLIFGILKTFDNALNAGVDLAGADRLITMSKISLIQPLPYAHYNKIKAVEGVEEATYAVWFGGYYQDPKNFIASFAIDPETYLAIYPEMVIPEDQKQAFLENRRAMLVGQDLAKQWGWKLGDTVPIISSIWEDKNGSRTWEFEIAAIFTGRDEEIDTRSLMFHYDYLNEARRFGNDTIGWLIVKTVNPDVNTRVSQTIDGLFENSPNETKTSTEEAFGRAFLEQFGNIGLIITSVVGAAFFTILLIAGNTMILAVRERTNEIAVMKTLGFTNSRIVGLIIGEAFFLVLLGGLPAIGMAWVLIQVLEGAMGARLPPMSLSLPIVLQALGYMVLLGIITGGWPALGAVRIQVAAALGRKL